MASITNNVPTPQAPGGRKLIVAPTIGGFGPSRLQFAIVWLSSFVVNSTLIALAWLIFPMLGGAAPAVQAEVEQTTEVQPDNKEYDLTNVDIGDGEGGPLVYDNNRIEDVSVPGAVDPTAAPGIVGAPEAAPMSVPPPPGSGGGTGAAPVDPTASGTGSSFGTVGGMGGLYNLGGFGGRSGSTKQALLKTGGGNKLSEAAVASGLEFLALHQAPDGHWSLNKFNQFARTAPIPAGKIVPDNSQPMTTRDNSTAGTAFGLLPFLAAGITNKPGKSEKDGGSSKDYSKGVGKAIDWLIARQDQKTGNYGGDMYSHGLASIAMAEAYGLTSDPRIKRSAQMGINYILAAQDPSGGGWRYTPRTAGDTSVTGWQLMALKSGQMSGLTVPKTALKKVEQYLDSCESSNKGGYGYVAGSGETITMTAVGGLCRQYLGTSPFNKSLLATVERLKKTPPGSGNTYYEYYATQVMHHMGGEAWDFWNLGPKGDGKGGIRDALIAKQDRGQQRPGQKGSFPGDDHVGGRLGATSLSLLSLEVYYRHLPLYRRDAGAMKAEK